LANGIKTATSLFISVETQQSPSFSFTGWKLDLSKLALAEVVSSRTGEEDSQIMAIDPEDGVISCKCFRFTSDPKVDAGSG
jgi:hypothetical protein